MRFVDGEPNFLTQTLMAFIGWIYNHFKPKMTFGEMFLGFEEQARFQGIWELKWKAKK